MKKYGVFLFVISHLVPEIFFGDINQTELCMILCLFHSVKAFCI